MNAGQNWSAVSNDNYKCRLKKAGKLSRLVTVNDLLRGGGFHYSAESEGGVSS